MNRVFVLIALLALLVVAGCLESPTAPKRSAPVAFEPCTLYVDSLALR